MSFTKRSSLFIVLFFFAALSMSVFATDEASARSGGTGSGGQETDYYITEGKFEDSENQSKEWFSMDPESDYMTGHWGGWRDRLADKGITFNSSYVLNILGNPVGGMKTGQNEYTHSWGTDYNVDLEKAAGIKGLQFHTSFLWRAGGNLSHKYIGNTFTASNIYGSQEFKLYSLYLEETMFDGNFALKVGRIGAGDDFASSPIYWLYVNNAIDGNPISLPINLPFSTYPNATWGARAKLKLPHDFFTMAGVYNGDPRVGRDEAHGCDFSFRLKRGVFLVGEAGYKTGQEKGHKNLPACYKIGGFYDSGTFRQLYRDANGGSAVVTGNPFAKTIGNYGFYAHADQMVYRENENDDEGLTPWAAVTWAPDGLNQFPFFTDGGLVYRGLIPGRDDDITALGAAYGMWSHELALSAADAGAYKKVYELMFEATYRLQITEWVFVQPDIQYILHPGGTGYIKDALVIGTQVGVTF